MQHAAMHLTVSKPLLPNTDCEGSAIVAEGSWHPNFNETVIPVHQASAARPGKHQPSDTLQAAMPGTIHMSLVPHAELVGEYRVPNFVTEQEEVDIVHMLDTVAPPWKDSSFNGKHRYHNSKSMQVCNFLNFLQSCSTSFCMLVEAQQRSFACLSVAGTDDLVVCSQG